MARISDEKMNEIRQHANIVEVISKYVPLSKKGKNYVCTCPFHDDHDPSLSISEDKQIFKCFVCGTGGNVFSFVSRYENISYVESVLKVASMCDIDVSEYEALPQVTVDPKVQSYYKVNQACIDYTNYTLSTPLASSVKDYLHKRGITDALIQKFQIGYNPKDDALFKFLQAKKFSEEEMVSASVVRLTNSGIHDVFSHRITIPIHDRLGNPIAFTARRVDESDEAKYINTTQTDCYTKGDVIFNYHRARVACRKTKRVLLVEGAMDVIAFEKVGIEDAVATLGTACTKQQIQLLKNLNVKVDVCYDGDSAGINAIYKFGKLAKSMHLPFEIINNQTGLDPDEIIDHYGKDELIALSEKTISWIDFCFRYLQLKYRLDNYSQKVEFAKEMQQEIQEVEETFLKEQYYRKLYELTEFDMKDSKNEEKSKPAKTMNLVTRLNKGLKAEYEILGQMLLSRQASNYFKERLGFLITPACNALALYLINEYRYRSDVHPADLLTIIQEEDVKSLLIDISEWELAPIGYDEQVFDDACSMIQRQCVEAKIEEITNLIRKTSNPLEKATLMDEILKLKRQKNQYLDPSGSKEL